MIDDSKSTRIPAAGMHHSVVLDIQRLVLNGLPMNAAQGAKLQAAVQRELTLMLRQQTAPLQFDDTAFAEMAAPAIEIVAPSRPGDLGRRIARSIHTSLARLR